MGPGCIRHGAGNGPLAHRSLWSRWWEEEHASGARALLSWERLRGERARVLVGDSHVRLIANLINKLVDLPDWNESQEQELFEFTVAQVVEQVAESLPPPFYDLLHSPEYGLSDEMAIEAMAKDMVDVCTSKSNLVFLEDHDERLVIRAVVWVILSSMEKGCTLEQYTQEMSKPKVEQTILLKVFVEGALDVFFDEKMRAELAKDTVEHLPELPLLPSTWLTKAMITVLKLMSGVVQESLEEAFNVQVESVAAGTKLPILPAALAGLEAEEEERLRESYPDRPFVLQLRRIFLEKVLEEKEKCFPVASKCISKAWQTKLWGYLVDIVFHMVPGLDKIELTVQPFHDSLKESMGPSSDEASADEGYRRLSTTPGTVIPLRNLELLTGSPSKWKQWQEERGQPGGRGLDAPSVMSRQTSPRGMSRQTSPRGMSRQTSPRGMSRQTSPSGMSRQTSPVERSERNCPEETMAQTRMEMKRLRRLLRERDLDCQRLLGELSELKRTQQGSRSSSTTTVPNASPLAAKATLAALQAPPAPPVDRARSKEIPDPQGANSASSLLTSSENLNHLAPKSSSRVAEYVKAVLLRRKSSAQELRELTASKVPPGLAGA